MKSKSSKFFFALSFLLMSLSPQVRAEETETPKNLNCKVGDPGDESKVVPYGSEGLSSCEDLSRGKLKTIYTASGGRNPSFKWDEKLKFKCNNKCDDREEYLRCQNKYLAEAKKCESIAYLLSIHDRWDNDENYNTSSGKNSQNQMQPGMMPGQPGMQPGMMPGQMYGQLSCKSNGVETIDYDACTKFQSNLMIIEATKGIAYGAQGLVYGDKLLDSQMKNATETNQATGALKTMKDSAVMQKEMYQQRTVVDAAKLTYLYSIYEGMPNRKSIASDCEKISPMPITDKFGADNNNNVVTKKNCTDAAQAGKGGFAILMNEQQSEAMKAQLIATFASAGSNALLATLMNKRAGDINDAIAKIDAFKPIDPTVVSEEDARSTFCSQNPGLPQCLGPGLDRTFDTMNDNVISFGSGGAGTDYAISPLANTTGINSGSGGNDGANRNSVDSVGSAITPAANGFGIEKSSAATVTDGAIGSAGGGGSGSGSSGGGGGGSGGGPPLAKADPGGTQAAVQTKTANYGGGNGSISVMGGLGINKNKKDGKGEENPFSKLFGKDGPKDSGLVNFRNIASEKVGKEKDNLFDMISKRYSVVNSDKRLLEYELTNN